MKLREIKEGQCYEGRNGLVRRVSCLPAKARGFGRIVYFTSREKGRFSEYYMGLKHFAQWALKKEG